VPVRRARRQARPTLRDIGGRMIRRQNSGTSSSDKTRLPTASTPRPVRQTVAGVSQQPLAPALPKRPDERGHHRIRPEIERRGIVLDNDELGFARVFKEITVEILV
jgi:hypothetical protein